MLVTDIARLRGPSPDSVLLTLHRSYCKQIICVNFNVNYVNVYVRDALDDGLSLAAEDFSHPWLVRDAIVAFEKELNILVSPAEKVDPFNLQQIATTLAESRNVIKKFFRTYVNRKSFDKALERTCIAQDVVEIGRDVESMHLVEGCVQAGQPIPWVIGDMFVENSRPSSRCVVGVGFPSLLGELHQFEVWGVFRLIAQRLMAFGFNNRFLSITCFLTSDGSVLVSDVSSSPNLDTAPLYDTVYANGNSVRAAFSLCLLHTVTTPKRLNGTYALLANVNCYVTDGRRLVDLIDINAINEYDELQLIVTDLEMMMTANTYGITVAKVYLTDTSYKSCRRRLKQIYCKFLKTHSEFSWCIKKKRN